MYIPNSPIDKPTYIYGLYSPEGELRYIGKSTNPKARYFSHLHYTEDGTYRGKWVKSLQPAIPEMRILEVCGADWAFHERAWIEICRLAGVRLTNISAGGDGGSYPKSAEAVEKTASSHRGRKRPALTGQRISAALCGRKQSSETIAKRVAKIKGQKRSDVQRSRMRGRVPTPDCKQRLSWGASQKRKDTSSKFLGVHFVPKLNKWLSQTSERGAKKYFGVFSTEDEAARAYDAGTHKLGLKRRRNFP